MCWGLVNGVVSGVGQGWWGEGPGALWCNLDLHLGVTLTSTLMHPNTPATPMAQHLPYPTTPIPPSPQTISEFTVGNWFHMVCNSSHVKLSFVYCTPKNPKILNKKPALNQSSKSYESLNTFSTSNTSWQQCNLFSDKNERKNWGKTLHTDQFNISLYHICKNNYTYFSKSTLRGHKTKHFACLDFTFSFEQSVLATSFKLRCRIGFKIVIWSFSNRHKLGNIPTVR